MMRRPPTLPDDDPNPTLRQEWLAVSQSQYKYNHDKIPPLASLDDVPEQEWYSARYKVERIAATADLVLNGGALKVRSIFDPFNELQDFEDLYPTLPEPATLNTWRTDAAFAEQRLSGANPMMLKRVVHKKDLPFKMAGKLPGVNQTIEDAIKAGQLYAVDYSDLGFIQGGISLSGKQKHLPTPKALFYWNTAHMDALINQLMGHDEHGQLLPLAIQVKAGAPVYTLQNTTALDWFIAKLCVQIADANHHELSSHLCPHPPGDGAFCHCHRPPVGRKSSFGYPLTPTFSFSTQHQ